jgi:hypothetical protein
MILRPVAPNGSTSTWAPKCANIFSVWSRLASVSITVVTPGALRPASSTADLICAEATGVRYSIGAGAPAPLSAMGQRPPSACDKTSAPICVSGSRMRRIGRLRSDASPSKVAVTSCPATTPIISREPVPALPKSSVSRGATSEPSPIPSTLQRPSAWRVMRAPSARQAAPVRSTSSPSSRPSISVRPTASRPRMKARCEMDLSPGGLSRPDSAPEGRRTAGGAWNRNGSTNRALSAQAVLVGSLVSRPLAACHYRGARVLNFSFDRRAKRL